MIICDICIMGYLNFLLLTFTLILKSIGAFVPSHLPHSLAWTHGKATIFDSSVPCCINREKNYMDNHPIGSSSYTQKLSNVKAGLRTSAKFSRDGVVSLSPACA